MKNFKNKVVVITGAASGMGRTLAVQLARLRAKRAMSVRILIRHAPGHGQLSTEGFEKAQIDVEADRNDACLDIRDSGLGSTRRFSELLLGHPLGTPAGAKGSCRLPEAPYGMGEGLFHSKLIVHRRYFVNIAKRRFF